MHFIRRHNTVRDHEPVEGDELSGTKLWPLCRFDWNETERFLGFGIHDFCRTLSCFYASSQSEMTTQTLFALSILSASLLVFLRV